MADDIRAVLREALAESRAETARLEKALAALGAEPGEPHVDARRNSWHRGRDFIRWVAQQDVGTVVTREQMREQFGYTSSSMPLGHNRWFNFTRVGSGEYRYDGCRGHLPKQEPELSLVYAAMQRQGIKPLDDEAAWAERRAAAAPE